MPRLRSGGTVEGFAQRHEEVFEQQCRPVRVEPSRDTVRLCLTDGCLDDARHERMGEELLSYYLFFLRVFVRNELLGLSRQTGGRGKPPLRRNEKGAAEATPFLSCPSTGSG